MGDTSRLARRARIADRTVGSLESGQPKAENPRHDARTNANAGFGAASGGAPDAKAGSVLETMTWLAPMSLSRRGGRPPLGRLGVVADNLINIAKYVDRRAA